MGSVFGRDEGVRPRICVVPSHSVFLVPAGWETSHGACWSQSPGGCLGAVIQGCVEGTLGDLDQGGWEGRGGRPRDIVCHQPGALHAVYIALPCRKDQHGLAVGAVPAVRYPADYCPPAPRPSEQDSLPPRVPLLLKPCERPVNLAPALPMGEVRFSPGKAVASVICTVL